MKASFFGYHCLFMLPCRAFNPRLKLCGVQRCLLGGKGIHHLGRQVWKLSEIKWLRHAPFYQIRNRKPNKTMPNSTR